MKKSILLLNILCLMLGNLAHANFEDSMAGNSPNAHQLIGVIVSDAQSNAICQISPLKNPEITPSDVESISTSSIQLNLAECSADVIQTISSQSVSLSSTQVAGLGSEILGCAMGAGIGATVGTENALGVISFTAGLMISSGTYEPATRNKMRVVGALCSVAGLLVTYLIK